MVNAIASDEAKDLTKYSYLPVDLLFELKEVLKAYAKAHSILIRNFNAKHIGSFGINSNQGFRFPGGFFT